MSHKSIKIGTKQALGFGIILVVLGGINVFTLLRMNALREQINVLANRRLASAVAISDINYHIALLRTNQLQHAFATSDESKQEQATSMIGLINEIEQDQDEYVGLITYDEERALYARFEEQWERYLEIGYQFLELSLANENQAAIDLLNEDALGVFDDVSETLEELVDVNQRASVLAAARAEETFRGTRRTIRILIFAAILLSVIAGVTLVRLVTVPVRSLVEGARRVADGDIDVELEVLREDEVGQLSRTFNDMTASLRAARDQIRAQQSALQESNDELEQKTRNLEQALAQLQEAQQQLVIKEKMASLGDLVAGVAHEINNPVGAIHSAADTSTRSMEKLVHALESCSGVDELKKNTRFMRAIEVLQSNNDVTRTASERITTIVKSLKNFARLDESEYQRADLHEGIDSTLTLLEHRLKNRIDVIKEYGDLPKVSCFPNQLNQVFMNVLSNAEQSIDGKGAIRIRSTLDKGAVRLEFSDDGCGIREEQVDRVFDPGFTTKGVGVGTGLGMSITYNIIKRHNGEITIDSLVGKGTTVTITLPLHPEQTHPPG